MNSDFEALHSVFHMLIMNVRHNERAPEIKQARKALENLEARLEALESRYAEDEK